MGFFIPASRGTMKSLPLTFTLTLSATEPADLLIRPGLIEYEDVYCSELVMREMFTVRMGVHTPSRLIPSHLP